MRFAIEVLLPTRVSDLVVFDDEVLREALASHSEFTFAFHWFRFEVLRARLAASARDVILLFFVVRASRRFVAEDRVRFLHIQEVFVCLLAAVADVRVVFLDVGEVRVTNLLLANR